MNSKKESRKVPLTVGLLKELLEGVGNDTPVMVLDTKYFNDDYRRLMFSDINLSGIEVSVSAEGGTSPSKEIYVNREVLNREKEMYDGLVFEELDHCVVIEIS